MRNMVNYFARSKLITSRAFLSSNKRIQLSLTMLECYHSAVDCPSVLRRRWWHVGSHHRMNFWCRRLPERRMALVRPSLPLPFNEFTAEHSVGRGLICCGTISQECQSAGRSRAAQVSRRRRSLFRRSISTAHLLRPIASSCTRDKDATPALQRNPHLMTPLAASRSSARKFVSFCRPSPHSQTFTVNNNNMVPLARLWKRFVSSAVTTWKGLPGTYATVVRSGLLQVLWRLQKCCLLLRIFRDNLVLCPCCLQQPVLLATVTCFHGANLCLNIFFQQLLARKSFWLILGPFSVVPKPVVALPRVTSCGISFPILRRRFAVLLLLDKLLLDEILLQPWPQTWVINLNVSYLLSRINATSISLIICPRECLSFSTFCQVCVNF